MQPHPETGQPAEVWERDEYGVETRKMQPVLKTLYDLPYCALIPPDRVIIDAGADWTNPAQSAAFFGIEWPMKLDEVRRMEKDPVNPWRHLEESVLRSGQTVADSGNAKSIRTAREGGTDRYDQSNTANEFSTIWVTEWYVRSDDEDWTFYTVGNTHMLSEPKPVEELYPWNDGDRPLTFGYGSLESHKIFPMSPAESWQPLQTEINDLGNLTLDSVKMNIAPLAKVKRGRQVDLEKLRTRGPGTNLLMTDLEDVDFVETGDVGQGAWAQMERLNNDFDSFAGQFDQSSVMSSRSLNETVGGMRLLSGAANALGEFDQRLIIETWTEPAIGQIVKLCQYYEHDETILALCGDRAQLWQKHGINQITDQMLDAQVSCRIDVGLGMGDPQQRMGKFAGAAAIVGPLIENDPRFAPGGTYEINIEQVFDDVFGGAGYRDGGKRFLTKKEPQPAPPDPKARDRAAEAGDASRRRAADRRANRRRSRPEGVVQTRPSAKIAYRACEARARRKAESRSQERKLALDMQRRANLASSPQRAQDHSRPAGDRAAAPARYRSPRARARNSTDEDARRTAALGEHQAKVGRDTLDAQDRARQAGCFAQGAAGSGRKPKPGAAAKKPKPK